MGTSSAAKAATAAALFLGLEPASRHRCRKMHWFGSHGDGGYNVCTDHLIPGNCVVYSLGTRENPSFDLELGKYGCEVHSFDPTLRQQGLSTAAKLDKTSNVTFHDVGIGGRSMIHAAGKAPWQWPGLGYGRESNDRPWTFRTLDSLMRELGHSRIDVLKMDVEGAEWPLLEHLLSSARSRDLLASGALVRQFILEVHLLPRPDTTRPGRWHSWTPPPAGWWRTPLALLGLLPTPAYPVPSAADADAFNWAAVDMLRQLVHLGGFRLLSHRVNSGAPHFNVSAPTMARVNGRPVPQFDRPKQMVMSCCQELLFAWKHPGHAN
jgi:FkbM family methyltransferase